MVGEKDEGADWVGEGLAHKAYKLLLFCGQFYAHKMPGPSRELFSAISIIWND